MKSATKFHSPDNSRIFGLIKRQPASTAIIELSFKKKGQYEPPFIQISAKCAATVIMAAGNPIGRKTVHWVKNKPNIPAAVVHRWRLTRLSQLKDLMLRKDEHDQLQHLLLFLGTPIRASTIVFPIRGKRILTPRFALLLL